MLELERSRIKMATELEQLHDQKDNLQEHLSVLKQTLVVVTLSHVCTCRHASSRCVSVFFFRFVALLKRHGPFVVHLAGCGVSGVNLCSCDTASRDHAFHGLLASPTLVSKTPRGRCVNRVKHPLLRLFSTPK